MLTQLIRPLLRTAQLAALFVPSLFLLTGAGAAGADPMQQWESWVLEKHPQHSCPWAMSKGKKKSCIWPGELTLDTNEQGATFSYSVDVFQRQAFIALPGDLTHWPAELSVNGQPAAIVDRNNRPHFSASAGKYKVNGRFSWTKRPAQLAIPQDVAIVTLKKDGATQQVDRRNGQLIFAGKTNISQKKASDSLRIDVFRLLTDGVPVTLVTDITLSVSGKAREVSFGSVMLADSEVVNIRAAIPARIEADGSMRAQVTAGEHKIQVSSRFVNSPASITTRKASKEWPQYEYISFKSATAIRQTKLTGLISVDTSQISIPGGWQEYPTYRISDGETLSVETEFRGDSSPGANQLQVNRDLWLDFDGEGITSLDNIYGEMNRDWRLNAAAGTRIGRASVDNEPVLITQDGELQGIEVRSPNVALQAVTRTAVTSGFSASGWNALADEYNATLHLPPGWRVLHAGGVDHVWGTWLSKWDLWDVFLVLIIVSATRKLISNRAAILAGGAFIIALHEPGTPLLTIPLLLIVLALLPVLSGRLLTAVRAIGVVLTVILVLSTITFAVSTFRLAIYPSLERGQIGTYSRGGYDSPMGRMEAPPSPSMMDDAMIAMEEAEMDFDAASSRTMNQGRGPMAKTDEVVVTAQKRSRDLYQVTESDKVQTGPGLPTWTWNSVGFQSSSPVAVEENLSIVYSSPFFTTLWRVLAVFLVAWYAGLVIMRLARSQPPSSQPGKTNAGDPHDSGDTSNADSPLPEGNASGTAVSIVAGISLLALGAATYSPKGIADEYPPEYLLKQLEQRLKKAPECLPGCASLNNGRITVAGTQLSIEFDAYADADISLPLPFGHSSWALQSVSDGGSALPLRRQQDKLFVALSKGHHRLQLKGNIIGDQATISLPLAMHNLTVSAPNWAVEGLVDGRARNNTLTFRASDRSASQKTDTLKADPAPAFVRVERQFNFEKKWTIETTVRRIAPQQGAISVPVKLIKNEKLLQDPGLVKNGELLVQLDHRQREYSWVSTFDPAEQITLQAADGKNYVEQWSFTPASLWRLEYEGIPSVKAAPNANAFEPVFKPWPNESLTINIRKPQGVEGETHTVESAFLNIEAGNKLQRSQLTLMVLSSLGTNYSLTLPENSEALDLSVDGQKLNTPPGRDIKVPLHPGTQTIQLEFQSRDNMGLISHSPELQLPDGATNIRIQYSLPRDRWPLYLSGPAIGPAMLFWGVLCVIILGALALPRLAAALELNIPVSLAGWLLLGLGLSTVNGYGVVVIAAMFFILAARKKLLQPANMNRWQFNGVQALIVLWVLIAVICMIAAIPMGLLSDPEMKVVGNGSSSHFYNYYQDISRAGDGFPGVTVVSVPIIAYRAVMLLWSLWLSTMLIQWASWAWSCYTEKETWRAKAKIDSNPRV